MANRQREGKVISFVGTRGGTGTTTVAHNVASALAQEYNTLLIELSPIQEALRWYTCTTPVTDLLGLLQMDPSEIGIQALRESICRLPQNLGVLFSPHNAETTPDISGEHAQAILEQAKALADYVILDVPRIPASGTRVAICCSSHVVLVTNPDDLAVRNAVATLGVVGSWGVNPALVSIVIVNNGRNPIPLKPTEVKAATRCQLMGVVPPLPGAYESSKHFGVPVVLEKPDSNAAEALLEIARRLMSEPVGSQVI